MRTIKFRVWFKAINAMYDPQLLTSATVNETRQDMPGLYLPFDKDTVLMQYTGLKDKNGKEIYEGDIVKFSRLFEEDRKIKELTSCVRFDEGKFGFDLVGFNGMFFDLSDDRNIEVIGNIFENKDLLNA